MDPKNSIEVLDFDEAINLLHVGAYNFKFRSARGGIFFVGLDHNNPPRLMVKSLHTEEGTQV